MREIEVKILNIDVDSIRAKLSSLKAKKVFDGKLDTVVFDTPDGKFKREGLFLRVRREGDGVRICFKGKVETGPMKIREETEVPVDDWAKACLLLEGLGYVRVFEYAKHRESYKLGAAKVELDTYEGVPTYIEIEAPSEKEVETAVSLLGFSMKQTTNISASELLKMRGIKTMD